MCALLRNIHRSNHIYTHICVPPQTHQRVNFLVGKPRMRWKPLPSTTSSRMASSLGPRVGRGKSSLLSSCMDILNWCFEYGCFQRMSPHTRTRVFAHVQTSNMASIMRAFQDSPFSCLDPQPARLHTRQRRLDFGNVGLAQHVLPLVGVLRAPGCKQVPCRSTSVDIHDLPSVRMPCKEALSACKEQHFHAIHSHTTPQVKLKSGSIPGHMPSLSHSPGP